ncbi:MAG: hypothetical protein GY749_43375 [Desulfobacteraceae bacterium]|nr:hypothetical protein [Desulfobacteraceae bacterium]
MKLQEIICCPECKENLLAHTRDNCYTCIRCSMEYPIVDNVIDFFPQKAERKRSGLEK